MSAHSADPAVPLPAPFPTALLHARPCAGTGMLTHLSLPSRSAQSGREHGVCDNSWTMSQLPPFTRGRKLAC